jgi:hypothetical protein
MRQEDITMSQQDLIRYHLLKSVLDGKITLLDSANAMKLSLRQARRLKGKVAAYGAAGVKHGNTGRSPAHTTDPAIRQRVEELSKDKKYLNTNDCHFSELLASHEDIFLSRATVTRIRRAADIKPKHKRRRNNKHHKRRDRKEAMGMMMQWDGSSHNWFGDAHPKCCLMGAIDDATNEVVGAHFVTAECSVGYLTVLKQIVMNYGIPCSIYQDGHSSLQRNDKHWSLKEELAGCQEPTQVGAVLKVLGIEAIAAHSPEAKGRIERLWGTLQDRLPVELQLANITTIEEANAFLPTFIAKHNKQFALTGKNTNSVWRSKRGVDIEKIFAFRYEATVGNDNAVRLGGYVFDIPPGAYKTGYAKKKVEVRQLLDGRWRIYLQEHLLLETPAMGVVEPIRSYSKHHTARGAKEATVTPSGSGITFTRGKGVGATRLA